MNNLRRAAIVRGAQMVAGALAGGALVGRGMDISPSTAPYTTGRSIGAQETSPEVPCIDPVRQARWKAAQPLEDKINQLQGYSGFSLSRALGRETESSYLPALKSTAPWWRASVHLDQTKKRATAIQTLQDQINKIMQSPLDKLNELADEALGAFMAEIQK